MHCRFCGYPNREGDVRCARCEGRLRQSVVSGRSSAVPLEEPDMQPVPTVPPPVERQRTGPPRQAALFDNNLISFPGPSTRAVRAARQARATVDQRPPKVERKTVTAQHKAPPARRPATTQSTRSLSDTILSATQERLLGISGQQRLDLASETQSVPARRSDWPVAPPGLRVRAAAADAAVILSAVALSLVPFYLAGGHIGATPKALLWFGAYFVLMALFYEMFWCVLKRESFGVARQQIRLVSFEGDFPSAHRRWARLGAIILGALAAGLGLLWALVDQESLAWHDHISQTYPTVNNRNPGTFRRG